MVVEVKNFNDIATSLIELRQIDTLYGDLYLWRAKNLLHDKMPLETYRGLQRTETELKNLPNKIHNAMGQGNWPAVKEMSAQMQVMKQRAEQDSSMLTLAKALYEDETIPIDPFSPGIQRLAGNSVTDLSVLRDRCMRLLGTLIKSDTEWRAFYTSRQNDMLAEGALDDVAPSVKDTIRTSPAKLQQEAQEALENGNFDKLRQLADTLSEVGAGETATVSSGQSAEVKATIKMRRFDFTFPDAVLERARMLGLAPFKVESRFDKYAQLASICWQPTFADLESAQGRLLALPLTADAPEALLTRIELFVLHPFINSAGVRFLPPLVDEDVLVEDFAEPAANSAIPVSSLLEALKLNRRNSRTRMQIETALAERGFLIVKDELGLDPYQFRLVCIPPDLHLRIGMSQSWGSQEIWTHFDGYMLTANGKMQALAGGDVRFGGIYDMLGISRNYEADRIIARFAVVQRRRMARMQVIS